MTRGGPARIRGEGQAARYGEKEGRGCPGLVQRAGYIPYKDGMPRSFRAGLLVSAVFFAVFFVPAPAAAQEDSGSGGVTSSSELELQLSSRPEIKACFIQAFVFPFLAGSGPLTRGNNIATVLSADVTPVSVNGSGELIWTPVAFFLLSGGGRLGSGWNMPLGKGIGINAPEDSGSAPPAEPPRKAEIFGDVFDGLVWSSWGAGTFQFDLGAVIPGDWTHVLFQTRQEFRYKAYTRAHSGESWIYENDDGENHNGWNYYASYVLGYSMPESPVLDTVAFMAELNRPLPPRGVFWGGDLGKWTVSVLFNCTITPRLSTTLAVQMRTRRNHGGYNLYNEDYYYKELDLLEEEGRRHFLFYRVALIMDYKIR